MTIPNLTPSTPPPTENVAEEVVYAEMHTPDGERPKGSFLRTDEMEKTTNYRDGTVVVIRRGS